MGIRGRSMVGCDCGHGHPPVDAGATGVRRDEVIRRLQEHEGEIRAFGVEHLHLYGSHARDEAGADSDLDVLVDFAPASRFGFTEYTGLIHLLEDLFATEVDVSTRNSLHPVLRQEIEASAMKVF